MAVILKLLKDFFTNNDYFNKIIELIIMISCGLLAYLIISYFSKSLEIFTKSHIFKRKINKL